MTDVPALEMPAGIIGNGAMLAAVGGNGNLIRLFWPHIDTGQHMGCFYTGLKPERGETIWLHAASWQRRQYYVDDTNIFVTRLTDPQTGLTVEQTDFVLPAVDVLVRNYRLSAREGEAGPLSLISYLSLFIDESPLYDGMYVEFSRPALVQFRRGVYFALAAPGHRLLGYHCGRRGTYGDPLEAAGRGEFFGTPSNIRYSAGAAAWSLPPGGGEITLYLAAGHTEDEVLALLDRAGKRPPGDWRQKTAAFWRGWLPPRSRAAGDTADARLYRRSLLTLKLLQNRKTGGLIAAPEFDPYYAGSGGYGYCWPRDGTYAAVALAEAGCLAEAAAFYHFADRIQNEDGSWEQRYFTDGLRAPTWGQQIDQVGTVLWGYGHYAALTGDGGFVGRVWPGIKRAAGYLIRNLSPDNHLQKPSMGIWEDTLAQSTYSAAATYAGLTAAAKLAALRGENGLCAEWSRRAEEVRQAVLVQLWDEEQGYFIRAVSKQAGRGEYEWTLANGGRAWATKDPAGLYETYWIARDTRVNAAVLAVAFPFRLLAPSDAKVVRCLERIRQVLGGSPAGGLKRYEGDTYAGGNPWVLTTLWAALVYLRQGRHGEARPLYDWVLANASPTGLLPEQVDRERGGPAWVLPLAWSHAMFILCHLAMQDGLRGL